ncbi:MAG: VWD domain-containing protein [Ilumatobacter sp.]|nr:VWD domain-containing protein [Ilumatobacter sp.]
MAEGWHLLPDSILLTEDGQTGTAELFHVNADGERDGTPVPDSIVVTPNADAGIDLDIAPDGTITATGGSEVGEEVVSIAIDGELVGPLWLTSARLQPGVEVLGDARIAYPKVGSTTADLAPFTLEELTARVDLPSGTDVDPAGGDTVMAVVLNGAPPAADTYVVNVGETPVMGQVIEPPDLPTLQRDGRSLISILVTPLNTIYTDLAAGLSVDDLDAMGFFGDTTTYECADGIPAAECPPLPTEQLVPRRGDRARAESKVTVLGTECETSGSFIGGEVKLAKLTSNVKPKGRGVLASVEAGEHQGVIVELGYTTRFEFGPEVKLQAAAAGALECELASKSIAVPVTGALAALADGELTAALVLALELKAAAGPALTVGATCVADGSLLTGFTWTTLRGLEPISEKVGPTVTCDPVFTPTEASNGAGIPLAVEFSATLRAELRAGIRVGGGFARVLGEEIGVPDLGLFQPLVVAMGVKGVVALENSASVLANEASGAKAEVSIVGNVTLSADLFQVFFKDTLGITGSFAVDLISIEVPVETFLKPVDKKDGGITATSNGEALSQPFEMTVGETLEVRVATTLPDAAVPVLPEAATDYVRRDGTYEAFDKFTWAVDGDSTLVASKPITQALCDAVGSGKQIGLVAETEVGPVTVPAWAGSFELKCAQNVTIEPATIELTRSQPTSTFAVQQEGYTSSVWSLRPDFPAHGEIGIALTPSGGSFPDEDQPVQIDASVTCPDGVDEVFTQVYRVYIGETSTETIVTVDGDCRRDYFRVGPDAGTAPVSITIDTAGDADDTWTAAANPGTGFLRGNESTSAEQSVLTAVIPDRDPPECGQVLAEVTRLVTFSTTHRGSDSVLVTYPERRGAEPPCDPPPTPPTPPCGGCVDEPSGTYGDPHVASFDGLLYDAQVLGEYTLAESATGDTRIVARFETARTGGLSLFRPTSTTGLSVETAGHQVEVYARPGLRVFVDGAELELAPRGVAMTIGDGVILTRNEDGSLDLAAPALLAHITTFRSVTFSIDPGLSVLITTPADGSLTGLLGTHDGDPANDLTLRTGGTITIEEALQHDVALYSFTDSWRLTDLADSPFTVGSSVFTAPNEPRPDSEALAPYRLQASEMLGPITSVCDGAFEATSRMIDLLALELAIGGAPADLTQYTCTYMVTGSVHLDDPDVPVLGATVVADADGLTACTATVDASGRYSCSMFPDLAELGTGSGVAFPLSATVAASAPGSEVVAVSGSASWASPPAFGQRVARSVNLVMPIGAVRSVRIDGTATQLGDPFTARMALDLTGTTISGDVVIAGRWRPTPAPDGTFTITVPVPADLEQMTAVWRIGLDGQAQPSATFDGFVDGTNVRTATFAHHPPAIDITGTARYNGAAPGSLPITVTATLAGGGTWATLVNAHPAAATGAYAQRVLLPDDAISAVLSSRLGHASNPAVVTSIGGLAAGAQPVAHDVIVDAPVLYVAGVRELNGQPYTSSTRLQLEVQRSSGAPLTITRSIGGNLAGTYSTLIDLPSDSTSAVLKMEMGVLPAAYPNLTVDPLVPGYQDVPFDAILGAPEVLVTGAVTGGGLPSRTPFGVRITAQPSGYTTTATVTPDASGVYSVRIPAPADAASITVTAEAGFSAADHVSTMVTSPVNGTNEVTLDVAYAAVGLVISGTLSDHGTPITTSEVLTVRRLDGAGALLGATTVDVQPDSSGRYTIVLLAPTATVAVELSTAISPFTNDPLFRRFDGLVAGSNAITFDDDYNPPVARLSGTFTAGGLPMGGNTVFRTTSQVELVGGGTGATNRTTTVFVSPADGSYQVDLVLPRAAVSTVVQARVGPEPDAWPALTMPSLVDGPNEATFSADLPLPVIVDLQGQLRGPGLVPYTTTTTVVYEALDSIGTVIWSTSKSTLPDSFGEFVEHLVLPDETAALRVKWNVGLPADTPVTEVFDGLAPGSNVAVFLGEHHPPVLQITGIVTVNGAAYDHGVHLVVVAERAGGGSWTSTTSAVLDPGSGAYARSMTLPRDATSAIVTVDLGQPLDPEPATVVGSLVGGPNAVTADGVFSGPYLRITGEILVGGAAPPGNTTVTVTATADGHDPLPMEFDVNPANDGGYALDVVLPAWATGADLAAALGPNPADYPTLSVTGLTAGDQPVTFDAIIADQRIDIAGTVTIDGQPWPGPLTLVISGWTTFGGSYTRVEPVQVDSGGTYLLQFTPPDDTVDLEVQANVGPSPYARPEQAYTGLSAGVSTLTFDVALPGRAVHATGILLSGGEPVAGSTSLYLKAYPTGGTTPSYSSSVTVTVDGSGHYDTAFLVPDGTVSVELASQLGEFVNDRVDQSFTGLVDGINDVAFDDDYVPPLLHVVGTLQTDGVPVTSAVTFDIEWNQRLEPSGVFPQIRSVTVTPDSSGRYEFTAVGPRLADDAKVAARLGISSLDYPSTTVDPLVLGVNEVTLDADYESTGLTVSGTMHFRGEPVTSESIEIRSYAAGGASLGSKFVPVAPDPVTGEFSVTTAIPANAEDVDVIVILGVGYSPWRYFQLDVDTTPGQLTVAPAWNIATLSMVVSGTVSNMSGPMPDHFFTIDVTHAAPGVTSFSESVFATTDETGEYSLELFLRPGTQTVTLAPSLLGVAPVELDVTGVVSTHAVDFVSSVSGNAVITGTISENGASPTVAPVLSWRSVYGPEDPFEGSSGTVEYAFTDENGSFEGFADVDDSGAQWIEFSVTFPAPGNDVVYRKVFDIGGQFGPFEFQLDIAHTGDWLRVVGFTQVVNPDESGETYCEYSGAFPFVLTVWAYDGFVGDPGTTQTLVEEALVVPTDATNFDLYFAVPPGTQKVVLAFGNATYLSTDLVDLDTSYLLSFSGPTDQYFLNSVAASCTPVA